MCEIILKNDPFCGKSVYVWSRNVATIVGNIMPAKIISEHKHDMRLLCRMGVFPENRRYGNPQKDHKKNEKANRALHGTRQDKTRQDKTRLGKN